MKTLKNFLNDLNDAWLNKRFDDLYKFFDKDVVMLLPGSSKSIVGADAMVESYHQFTDMGVIHSFQITDLSSFEFDQTIMCHMQFAIDYEVDSGRFQEKGLEIYALKKSGGTLKIIWRTQVTLNTENL